MIHLNDRDTLLRVVTSSAGDVHYAVSYDNIISDWRVSADQAHGTISGATTTTLVTIGTTTTEPFRYVDVKSIFLKNADTASNTVMLKLVTGATDTELTPAVTLLAEESLILSEAGLVVFNANGESKSTSSKKSLGQSAPSATTETDLYTVPAGKTATLTSLFVCNRGAAAGTFRVSASVGGGATANKDYLYYDVTIAAYDTFLVDAGGKSLGYLSATDKVRVYASSGDFSFNLFGEES